MSGLIIPETSHGSPLTEYEALGHVADKIGEIRDCLVALAVQQPMTRMGQRLNTRKSFAFLIGKFGEGRDAMRAVSLLRGDDTWLMLARQMDQSRDSVTKLAKKSGFQEWPAAAFLAMAQAFEKMRYLVTIKQVQATKLVLPGNTMH